MNKRVSLGAAIAMLLLVAAFTFSITFDYATQRVNTKMVDLREREAAQAKYAEIDREVRENYPGTIDETQLLDSVAKGYLAGIGDPYATYYDARTYERILRAQENPVADIGAVLRATPDGDGYLVVEEVYPDSPALSAGMAVGDLIIKIDDIDLTPENSVQMLESIQGEQGTALMVTVRSGGVDRIENMTRRVVVTPCVYSRMIADTGVGYILIKEFNDNTNDQFKRELRKMTGAGAQSLIFDVRDNKGGRLSAATRILDSLVPTGDIVFSVGKDGTPSLLAGSDAYEVELPMVVLMNAGTASSAELFAQVLRDYDKARTVGVTTTGKGVMLSLIKLSDGSAIEITTAKLMTPSGAVFDGVGIKPDYEVTMEGDWQGLDENSDPQLKKALEVAVGMHRIGDPPPADPNASEMPGDEPSEPAGSSVAETPPPFVEPNEGDELPLNPDDADPAESAQSGDEDGASEGDDTGESQPEE